ncbi:MAG: lipoprotein-releasing system transmembrane subunit LolC [Rickettsiales bacterium]|nr:lipoprotein-releasing system transmembrane subunit LolC [Rickettsiales bacterium]
MISSFEFFLSTKYLFPKTRDSFFSIITFFSLMGIALGVATLIIVMSVMNGFRTELISKFLGVNGHFKIEKYDNSKISDYSILINQLESKNSKLSIEPTIISQGLVSSKGFSSGIFIKGISESGLSKRKIFSKELSAQQLDNFQSNKGILIGKKLKHRLDLDIGDNISIISSKFVSTPFGDLIRNSNFSVIGTFETGMFEYDISLIIFPLNLLQNFLSIENKVHNLEIHLDEFDLISKYKNNIKSSLSKEFLITDWREMNPSLFNAIQVEKNVMFLILFLIVLVAVFNLISSMVMLVNNKRKDIGILKMIGLTNTQILKIFIINGFLIGLMGTMIGLILGLTFCYNINEIKEFIENATNSSLFSEEIYFFTKLPMIVNYNEVLIISTLSMFLSFIATIYPALKASKVEPINLIKWE